MKKKVFAVCDLESGYAYRLMDYIYEKEAGTFEVQAFKKFIRICQRTGN